ncbi:polyketide cyclase [Aureimonas altamirensis]|uniref:Polyketide cyclase n=2 Tax=Aureimonas altamirensis TaxID=370622 RepID=A0A0B1Q2E9_9HYPH|nr:nuclear transport factor 2 family protein [Aureimonas altamirensis]KHJ53606.1 polyketide cyclase [Aureimonas altamirensis]
MTEPGMIADAYLSVWNEADDAKRLALLAEGWSRDARYVDPLMSGEGHAGIATLIGAARAQFPGHSFTLRGTPDGHGAYVRFAWNLAGEDGPVVAGGTDVVKLDDNGRIVVVVGFLDGGSA